MSGKSKTKRKVVKSKRKYTKSSPRWFAEEFKRKMGMSVGTFMKERAELRKRNG